MRMSRVTRILASLLLLYSYSHSHASASEVVDVATFLSGKERDGSATNGLKEESSATIVQYDGVDDGDREKKKTTRST